MKILREMRRGDTKGFEIEISEDNSFVQVDKMYFTVKDSYCTDDVIFQKSLGSGITIQNDKYYVVINPEDTENLEYGRYVYDCEFIKDGIKRTIEEGILYIKEEVTFSCNEV